MPLPKKKLLKITLKQPVKFYCATLAKIEPFIKKGFNNITAAETKRLKQRLSFIFFIKPFSS